MVKNGLSNPLIETYLETKKDVSAPGFMDSLRWFALWCATRVSERNIALDITRRYLERRATLKELEEAMLAAQEKAQEAFDEMVKKEGEFDACVAAGSFAGATGGGGRSSGNAHFKSAFLDAESRLYGVVKRAWAAKAVYEAIRVTWAMRMAHEAAKIEAKAPEGVTIEASWEHYVALAKAACKAAMSFSLKAAYNPKAESRAQTEEFLCLIDCLENGDDYHF